MDLMSTAQLLGNFGEFFGAILLFISLIYVGRQIKQNTNATRAEVYQGRANSAQDYFLMTASDSELTSLLARIDEGGLDEIDKLTTEERRRFTSFHLAGVARLDNHHYQLMNGYLEAEYYEAVLVSVIRNLAPVWRKLDLGVRPSFRKEIDRIAGTKFK